MMGMLTRMGVSPASPALPRAITSPGSRGGGVMDRCPGRSSRFVPADFRIFADAKGKKRPAKHRVSMRPHRVLYAELFYMLPIRRAYGGRNGPSRHVRDIRLREETLCGLIETLCLAGLLSLTAVRPKPRQRNRTSGSAPLRCRFDCHAAIRVASTHLSMGQSGRLRCRARARSSLLSGRMRPIPQTAAYRTKLNPSLTLFPNLPKRTRKKWRKWLNYFGKPFVVP